MTLTLAIIRLGNRQHARIGLPTGASIHIYCWRQMHQGQFFGGGGFHQEFNKFQYTKLYIIVAVKPVFSFSEYTKINQFIPLGELTALPQTPWLVSRGPLRGMRGMEGKGGRTSGRGRGEGRGTGKWGSKGKRGSWGNSPLVVGGTDAPAYTNPAAYTVCGKKVSPKVIYHFLINHLEFLREILHVYYLTIYT